MFVDMITIVGAVISNIYGLFLSMYFWNKMLGRKYSLKFTVNITLLYSILGCLIKLVSFWNIGLNMVTITSIFTFATHVLYIIFLFESSVGKKVLVATFSMIMMIFMEVFSINVATAIFGEFELLQFNSWYTVVELVITNAFITIGFWLWGWLWRCLERIKWENVQYQWFCLILPLSQWFIVLHLTQIYSLRIGSYPVIVIASLVLSVMSDIVMFYLFYRSNNREKTEKELRQINYQYELEKIRYEQLNEGREEVAKIRHDFQNYILTIKNMKL